MNSAIFVSSSCVNNSRIAQSVKMLADQGFTNIELSGGTNLYPEWKAELITLKSELGLTYRCHNYFPPPKEHFVLNLSSHDKFERRRSIEHVLNVIELSNELEASVYGIHAGFRLQPDTNKLGKAFTNVALQPENEAIELFAAAWEKVNDRAIEHGVKLYVENNVLSAANHKTFTQGNPFLATDSVSIKKLQKATGAPLLLDIAHLKVSCNSLGLSFDNELKTLVAQSDYLHFSDNNGMADTNHGLHKGTEVFKLLESVALNNKTITLEVYDGSLQESYESTAALLNS
ncbi:sugar phosphate isomerase/epimerase family protein [Alteromonas stellipolaris]|uniref:sugar phosphate isomerase/epimerase family protein n=1 Tax=Alteromonas stellipolaris TaxID=233316 RepID=UPI0024947813|nr:sugar phosphate isomerase/epimerase [Alteromonas stellipolaris]